MHANDGVMFCSLGRPVFGRPITTIIKIFDARNSKLMSSCSSGLDAINKLDSYWVKWREVSSRTRIGGNGTSNSKHRVGIDFPGTTFFHLNCWLIPRDDNDVAAFCLPSGESLRLGYTLFTSEPGTFYLLPLAEVAVTDFDGTIKLLLI